MIKFKEFSTKEHFEIDEQLEDFINDRNIEVIDVKFDVILDTYNNIIMSFALLIYKGKGE